MVNRYGGRVDTQWGDEACASPMACETRIAQGVARFKFPLRHVRALLVDVCPRPCDGTQLPRETAAAGADLELSLRRAVTMRCHAQRREASVGDTCAINIA